MKRLLVTLVAAPAILSAGYVLYGLLVPRGGSSGAPTVAASVDSIRSIGDLQVLRVSVKEIVTSSIGEASWIKTPGKPAIICHFDVKYTYNLHKARFVAGRRGDGTRYCMIYLPRHEYEMSTKDIRFYDEPDGSWLGLAPKTPPDERTRVIEAARQQAESQAKAFLGGMEGEIQASAKTTLTQIARALGYSDVTIAFQK